MSSVSVIKPEALTDNLTTLNTVIRGSYQQARKSFRGGLSAFRDEINGFADKAQTYFQIISQPINNFLKDVGQIDQEFQSEADRHSYVAQTYARGANIIPIEQALRGSMEENY